MGSFCDMLIITVNNTEYLLMVLIQTKIAFTVMLLNESLWGKAKLNRKRLHIFMCQYDNGVINSFANLFCSQKK